MSTKIRVQSAALAFCALAISYQVMAHSGAMGIVKERMDQMSILGEHAKNIGDMLKGKATFDTAVIETAAQAFLEAGKQMPALFPDTVESREAMATEALPAIWADWDDFTALAEQFTQDSQSLHSLIKGLHNTSQSIGDQRRAVRAAFFKATKNCSSCHERFRLDQG